MDDKDIPNRASNMEKAEGDRKNQDQPRSGADREEIIDRSGASARIPRRYDQDAGASHQS